MFETLHVWHELWSDDKETDAVGLQSMMQYENEDDEEEAENPLPDGNSDDDILEQYTEVWEATMCKKFNCLYLD